MCYTEGSHTRSWGPSTIWQLHCKDFARGLRCHVLRNKRAEAKWVERKHSMLWIHYCGPRIDADTVNPRCCGRPLDAELYLSCVCNLFCRGFRCRAGIFSNGNIFLILAATEQYSLQASSWGLGRGGKGGKGARKELFPCSLHSPTSCLEATKN